jgi:hypothetical protein
MNLRNSLFLCIHFVTILTSEESTDKAKKDKFSTKPYREAVRGDAKKLGKKALAAFNLKYRTPEKEEQQQQVNQ